MSEEVYTPGSDINETQLLRRNKQLLDILLKDYTTGSNIKWGTDSYKGYGFSFHNNQEITTGLITGWYDGFIRPRADKDKEVQLERQRSKAEVYTPSWVVRIQVDAALEDMKNLSLVEFIRTKWIEITCGEAPYMVNRYDMNTGSVIALAKRSGFMDVKFRRLNQEVQIEDGWVKLALEIYKSSYGFEYQGDSLLLARENLMLTFIDNYFYMFGAFPNNKLILKVSEIVSLNVFQMDGLTYEVPYSYGGLTGFGVQLSLFEELDEEEKSKPQFAKVKCWVNGKIIDFKEIAEGNDGNMKFDVVIGNPPYQDESTGEGTHKPPIYHYFMDESYKIADKAILITPARFLFNAGATGKKWNEKMLNDKSLNVLYYEKKSVKVFENTEIKGGVAITYRDATKINDEPITQYIPYEELKTINDKVWDLPAESLSQIIFGQNIYFYTDKMHEDFPEAEKCLSNGHKYDLKSSAFTKLHFIFQNERPDDGEKYIGILGRENNKRVIKYIKKKYIRDTEALSTYNVIIPKANGSGDFGEVISSPVIAPPELGSTETFISMGAFKTEIKAKNLKKYLYTKFCRAMLGILKVTQDNLSGKWNLVPLQNFTPFSDIDWTQSIAEIDQQLYQKYGLSQEEINFIETNVKEMD